ncbi:pyruvate formate lyase 1-activating protein [Frischella japonica]|nr:pyruvate formate lyase 1-activating protein [Frischella japonica]
MEQQNIIMTTKQAIKGRIHSFESFGTVDGPGIRFIVFFQGCLMRCLYCHNRDTWDLKAGREVTVDELMKEIVTYKHFIIPNGGGVTASGGEAMLQAEFVTQWFKACHEQGIGTCLDTNGYARNIDATTNALMEQTDLVMLDLKQLNDDIHQKLVGVSNKRVLEFAKYLQKINKRTWIRYVVVPGWSDDDDSAHRLGKFIQGMQNIEKVEMLPYHKMGAYKWATLGDKYMLEGVEPPPRETMDRIQQIIQSYGHEVTFSK